MATGTLPITNFTAGEWSQKLYGRIDLARYGQACSELLNMTLMPHGAATRRMGTEFIAQCQSKDVRLIPFIFNEEQAYVLECTPGRIRFFRNGGLLGEKDVETPYTAGEIRELDYCQSADVMYLVCNSHPPYKLTRPGKDSFVLEKVVFTNAPKDWKEGNWPRTVTFHQQRLWMGGTPDQGQKLWASKTGESENFTTGTDEAKGLALSLVSEKVNAVRWLLSQKNLLVGTAGGEWVVSAAGAEAVTNRNIRATRNSNYGTAPMRPLLVGASTLHVSADRRRVRDLSYAFADDAYLSQDISLMAEHLTSSGIQALADCQNPDGITWYVLRDGRLAGCTYLKNQEVIGWHRHETRGRFLDVVCVPAAGFTETWLAVERSGGVFIERMKMPWDGESTLETGCWYVDCGLFYQGEPATRILGLDHLEEEEVTVLADGAAHPPRLVQNGGITLEWSATQALVGLPYPWALAPMHLEGLSSQGSMQGKKVRITEVMTRLYKSLGVHWELPGQKDSPYPLAARDVDMDMDAAPLPFSGDAIMTMPGGWTPDARARLSGDGAFPATIIMMVPRAVVNE